MATKMTRAEKVSDVFQEAYQKALDSGKSEKTALRVARKAVGSDEGKRLVYRGD